MGVNNAKLVLKRKRKRDDRNKEGKKKKKKKKMRRRRKRGGGLGEERGLKRGATSSNLVVQALKCTVTASPP